ncbi:hypothetical protein AB0I81_34880 [Nonomuraea sp. NPDC050404]|uniref:hypothetical protein n=1 Tax=Nonomuraea sp. NPDC050404 TaxID=3155783 RepID=UPI0033D3B43E
MNWAQVIPALLGTLIGGGISLITTRWTQANQWKIERDKRAAEREQTARISATEAAVKLIQIKPIPTEEYELRAQRAKRCGDPPPPDEEQPSEDEVAKWAQIQEPLVIQLRVAIEEFSDDPLRERLLDMTLAVTQADYMWERIGAPGSVTRRAACEHMVEVLGRYGRGADLPPLPEELQQALGAIHDQIEWWDSLIERQKVQVEAPKAPPGGQLSS